MQLLVEQLRRPPPPGRKSRSYAAHQRRERTGQIGLHCATVAHFFDSGTSRFLFLEHSGRCKRIATREQGCSAVFMRLISGLSGKLSSFAKCSERVCAVQSTKASHSASATSMSRPPAFRRLSVTSVTRRQPSVAHSVPDVPPSLPFVQACPDRE